MALRKGLLLGSIAGVSLAWAGCSGGDTAPEANAYARGEVVYRNVCVACHNADPSLQGSLGPPIAGSSRDLIEHRVLHGTYPEGYLPKQPSQAMPQFPHLEGSIDDLAAFLNGRAGG